MTDPRIQMINRFMASAGLAIGRLDFAGHPGQPALAYIGVAKDLSTRDQMAIEDRLRKAFPDVISFVMPQFTLMATREVDHVG